MASGEQGGIWEALRGATPAQRAQLWNIWQELDAYERLARAPLALRVSVPHFQHWMNAGLAEQGFLPEGRSRRAWAREQAWVGVDWSRLSGNERVETSGCMSALGWLAALPGLLSPFAAVPHDPRTSMHQWRGARYQTWLTMLLGAGLGALLGWALWGIAGVGPSLATSALCCAAMGLYGARVRRVIRAGRGVAILALCAPWGRRIRLRLRAWREGLREQADTRAKASAGGIERALRSLALDGGQGEERSPMAQKAQRVRQSLSEGSDPGACVSRVERHALSCATSPASAPWTSRLKGSVARSGRALRCAAVGMLPRRDVASGARAKRL